MQEGKEGVGSPCGTEGTDICRTHLRVEVRGGEGATAARRRSRLEVRRLPPEVAMGRKKQMWQRHGAAG